MHENLDFFKGLNYDFLVGLGLSLLAGFLIGLERESKDKPAGISTHAFVIGGSMIFTYLSAHVDPNSTSRIAALNSHRNRISWSWINSKKRGESKSYKSDNCSKCMVLMFYRYGNRIWFLVYGNSSNSFCSISCTYSSYFQARH